MPDPISADHLLAILESFPWAKWRARLKDDIDPVYRDLVRASAEHVFSEFSFDDPFTSSFATDYIGARITQLDDFTRQNVSDLIRRVLDESGGAGSSAELAALVAEEVRTHVQGYETWRANRIARAESGYAYNHGTLLGAKQSGGDEVDVYDGDSDPACAAANGARWSIEYALDNALEHPGCVRSFTPVAP